MRNTNADHNVLVSAEGEGPARVVGVLDLGDACVEVYALALGNSLFYAMLGLPLDQVRGVARDVVAGYCAQRQLSRDELKMAAVGARMRCLVSASMAGVSAEQHPGTHPGSYARVYSRELRRGCRERICGRNGKARLDVI